jgi:TetR/AcrR family transcriptional regulator, regulator of cefoperazone and chloramphenicol sensitivity
LKRLAENLMPDTPDAKGHSDPRQRLLSVAEEVFAQKGYDGASVREICSLAGMNVAAVNYHFGDKEKLYIEAVKFAHQCSMDQEENALPPSHLAPREKLRHFIAMMVRSMHGPVRPSALQLLMRELTSPSIAAKTVVEEFIQPLAFGLRAIIWELFPHLPEPQCMMIGFSIVGQCLYYRQNRRVSMLIFGEEPFNSLNVDVVAEHIIRFSLAALGLGEPYRDPKENS